MKEETMHRLNELEEIHLQLHCAVDYIRNVWVPQIKSHDQQAG